jgi:hypothetical protein
MQYTSLALLRLAVEKGMESEFSGRRGQHRENTGGDISLGLLRMVPHGSEHGIDLAATLTEPAIALMQVRAISKRGGRD